MVDDTESAQARELLQAMQHQAAIISHKVDAVLSRRLRTSAHGATLQRRQLSSLRRELHEAHRLIDGLHDRFPDALTTDTPAADPPNRPPKARWATAEASRAAPESSATPVANALKAEATATTATSGSRATPIS